MGLIGDFQRLGKVLLVIVVLGIVGFYLVERGLSKKVEEVSPDKVHELEHLAQEKLHDLKQEFQEHIPFKQIRRDEPKRPAAKSGDADSD